MAHNYIIEANPEQKGSGYGVVPKELDPYCKYNFKEVQSYYLNNPNKRLDKDYSVVTPDIPIDQQIREQRDQLISNIEWRVARHNHELVLDLPTTEPLLPLLEYIQALRDIPQQEGFPNNVEWPIVPEVLQGE